MNERCNALQLWAHLTPGNPGPGRWVPAVLGRERGSTRGPRALARATRKSPETGSDPRDPGANVPLEVLEELDEAMVGEAHRSAADCWPSGRGPSSPGLWRAGGVSAPIDVNRVWVRRWRGPPLASFQAETLDGVPWSEWAFPGHSCAPDRQDPRWGGWAVRGLWFVALPRSGWWDQPRVDQSGALSSAKGAHCPGNAP